MLLGDFQIHVSSFSSIEALLREFQTEAFRALNVRKKFDKVNRCLFETIKATHEPAFLLAQVIDYISRINKEAILNEPYSMLQFEFWLTHYADCTEDEEKSIRSKIVGKNINRDDYQLFFPIGMNKTLVGSHFVAAHLAPDVDTTIASFWGWVDAFGAKVGTSMHYWGLPQAVVDTHIQMLFSQFFGSELFQLVARKSATLSLTAQDLLSTKGFIKLHTNEHLHHQHAGKHIIVVDEEGHYAGDWRPSDAVVVNQVTSAFYSLIRWLEHTMYYKLISCYAVEHGKKDDIQAAIDALFATKLEASDAAKEFNDIQKSHVDRFIKAVLNLTKGLKTSFSELFNALKLTQIGQIERQEGQKKIFKQLELLFKASYDASSAARRYLERLDILLATKQAVLGIASPFITSTSEVEEIRTKMANLEYLPVLIADRDGKWFPVGVVYANDIKRKILGSVSLRDFSNENETKMASYLEVVSVIDHHKSDIKTATAGTILIGDAQSANTLVAEQTLKLNERYSLLGMAPKAIHKAIKTTKEHKKLKRLLELAINSEQLGTRYIHPMREYAEYLFFLHAILDDTDLLTKVSKRDLVVLAKLLNRMKSIATGQESEIVSFDAIANDSQFLQKASLEILQNDDMYSIYQKIYAHKEKEVETNLARCVKGLPSTIFSDTKEQNGCSRIGQTKLFSKNFASYTKQKATLQRLWIDESKKIFSQKPQIDLYMQMITTIASADEVYKGKNSGWKHKDELWIYLPTTQGAYEHLINFLNAFTASQLVQDNAFEVAFLGPDTHDLQLIFSQNFAKAPQTVLRDETLNIAVLTYKAGLLNSRKAYITPYLPRPIS